MLPRTFEHADAALAALATRRPDVLITDIRMPGMDGLRLIEIARRDHPRHARHRHHRALGSRPAPWRPIRAARSNTCRSPSISTRRSSSCARAAAPAPRRGAERRRRADTGHHRPGAGDAGGVPRHRPAVALEHDRAHHRRVRHRQGARRARAARHIPRANGPFVALNTSAIAAGAARVGAVRPREGRVHGRDASAAGGSSRRTAARCSSTRSATCRRALQTRLLRVLAEGEFFRVGGQTPIRVDVRVIAATHQDLDALRDAGAVPRGPATPPERDPHPRAAAARAARATSRSCSRITSRPPRASSASSRSRSPTEARSRLVAFAWPGNVRQLVNAARRLTVTAPGREIREEDIPAGARRRRRATPRSDDWCRELEAWAARHLAGGGPPLLDGRDRRFERTLTLAALERAQGKRHEAAKLIGWGRNTLTRKLRELGLE